MSTRTLLITLLASALALPALAQDADPAPAPAPAAPAVSVEGAAPTESSVSRDRDTLSVDFPDEDVKTILRNVADLFELNLVVPDTLTGKTSIKLRDVTWRQIFQVVLAPVGYTYVEEGNIIKIVSNDSLAMEPVSTDVFIINNAKAEDLRPTVAGLIDSAAGGKIEINTRSNALIITERPSRMGRIRAIIEQLDKATAQVMIESQFVEVTDRDVRNIGVNWASLQGMQFGVGGMTQTWNRSRGQTQSGGGTSANSNATTATVGNNSTNTSGSNSGTTNTSTNGTDGTTTNSNTTTNTTGFNVNPTNLDLTNGSFGNATLNLPSGSLSNIDPSVPGSLAVPGFTPAVAGAGDTPPTPATFTSPVTNSSSISSGSTSGTSSSTSTGTSSGTSNSITDTISGGLTNTASSVFNDLMSLTNTGGTNRLTSAVFSASDFNIIVSALKSQNNTKVVSNPTVVTLNNSEAVLNIGSEFPIPSYTYNSERGTFEVSGFQYKPIGIIMKVTPQVNAQGTIRLSLEPEVSQQNGETTFGGAGGATIPIIATRKVKTNISIKDGYTAGIGGLVTSNKNHGGTKVPVLGDIPVLGRLFSSKSVNDQSTNLLIFITAKTVNPDGAAPSDVFTDDALESVGMAGKK